jgi:hypothetical protein
VTSSDRLNIPPIAHFCELVRQFTQKPVWKIIILVAIALFLSKNCIIIGMRAYPKPYNSFRFPKT